MFYLEYKDGISNSTCLSALRLVTGRPISISTDDLNRPIKVSLGSVSPYDRTTGLKRQFGPDGTRVKGGSGFFHIVDERVANDYAEIYKVNKEELNQWLHHKYDRLPLFERVEAIAQKLSETFYNGTRKKVKTFTKLLKEHANFEKDYKKIYENFWSSKYSKIGLSETEIKTFINREVIAYEDALLFSYIKGILEGFYYEANIKQVVIDEAQDYNRLQYIIITKIFQKADFTILGDINQNINPYYHYQSLQDLKDLLKGDTKYIELLKTYRSSPEIIAYTNKILNLNHVNAIRKETNKPVVFRKNIDNLKDNLLKDIQTLQQEYQSIAIITKDMEEAEKIYHILKKETSISLLDATSKNWNKKLVVLPAYIAKGLEFDSVIIYNDRKNSYRKNERNLLYVACTRAQHELYIYN